MPGPTGESRQSKVTWNNTTPAPDPPLPPTLHEVEWLECLARELGRIRRLPEELRTAGKSVEWKVQLAARLKAETTVTNRWLSPHLHLGALHEVSRKVRAWLRQEMST